MPLVFGHVFDFACHYGLERLLPTNIRKPSLAAKPYRIILAASDIFSHLQPYLAASFWLQVSFLSTCSQTTPHHFGCKYHFRPLAAKYSGRDPHVTYITNAGRLSAYDLHAIS